MKSVSDIRAILDAVSYLNWEFFVGLDGPRPYLQVKFDAADTRYGGALEHQSGRKWFLSPHMTRSEIVTTALKAVLTAVEHEARESFRYRGRAIFGPHFDVEKLVRLCDTAPEDARTKVVEP